MRTIFKIMKKIMCLFENNEENYENHFEIYENNNYFENHFENNEENLVTI